MHQQQVGIAHRQQVAAYADRGQRKKGVGRRINRVGQLHAADLVVLRGSEHARFYIGLVGIVRGLRQDDLFTIKVRLLRVHQAVEGCIFFTRHPLAGVKHRVEGFARVV